MYRKMNAQQATRARRGSTAVAAVEAKGEGFPEGAKASLDGDALLTEGAVAVDLSASMKECPVCKARCFTDMPVCYNCLHSFGSSEPRDISRRTCVPGDGSLDGWLHSGEGSAPWEGGREVPAASAAVFDEAPSDEGDNAFLGPDGRLDDDEGPMEAQSIEVAAVPVGGPFGITVNVPEGLTASCESKPGKPIRPDQLMEVIISIKVAQDARSEYGAASTE